MRKPIHIFTLAEKEAFKTILHNFLGWAPESTYGPPHLNPVRTNQNEEIVNLLRKVRDEGGEIHVRHLFRPFAVSGYEQYDKHFLWSCLELLKILLDTKLLPDYPVVFELDENDPEDYKDLVLLERHSPPLYNKLVSEMEMTKSYNEVEVTCYGLTSKYPSREEAILFYEDCQLSSEGAERDCYTDILIQLRAGKKRIIG